MGEIIWVISARFVRVQGGVNCNFIINYLFLHFMVFCGVGGVGREFVISQEIWKIGVSGARIVVGRFGCIIFGLIRGRGDVNCFSIIPVLYFPFQK